MFTRDRLPSFAATAALLVLAGASPKTLSADETYPIWWSPSLELDSLDHIDARMTRDLWADLPDHGGLELYPDGNRIREKREARNCTELLDLRERGYFAHSTNNISIMWHFDSWCRAVAAFQSAKPAVRSFVHDFVLDRASVNYLPAFVVPAYSCHTACLQKEANDQRTPLAWFRNPFEITAADGLRLVIEDSISRESIEIVGRADFTHDGLEDLLVVSKSTSLEAWPVTVLHPTRFYVLSRDGAEGVLYVVDTQRHLCPTYECTPPYNIPEALREAD